MRRFGLADQPQTYDAFPFCSLMNCGIDLSTCSTESQAASSAGRLAGEAIDGAHPGAGYQRDVEGEVVELLNLRQIPDGIARRGRLRFCSATSGETGACRVRLLAAAAGQEHTQETINSLKPGLTTPIRLLSCSTAVPRAIEQRILRCDVPDGPSLLRQDSVRGKPFDPESGGADRDVELLGEFLRFLGFGKHPEHERARNSIQFLRMIGAWFAVRRSRAFCRMPRLPVHRRRLAGFGLGGKQ